MPPGGTNRIKLADEVATGEVRSIDAPRPAEKILAPESIVAAMGLLGEITGAGQGDSFFTPNGKIIDYLLRIRAKHGAGYLVLIDPDKWEPRQLPAIAAAANENGVDAILIGGSLLLTSSFDEIVKTIKKTADIPCIIFPGSTIQISRHADAILFLSLISGRNADYLIGVQVMAAPIIRLLGIEPIPTGYMLIESGRATSAEFMSNTRPIPRTKDDIAQATALAAEYLGMRLVYLEAGSGADLAVTPEMVKAVSSYVDIPVIVGGGIRTPEEAEKRVRAGASFVVIGNILENQQSNAQLIREFAQAIHGAVPPSPSYSPLKETT